MKSWCNRLFTFCFVQLLSLGVNNISAQNILDQQLPVRAFCISAPKPAGVDRFLQFIGEELADGKINTLILRVDYNYQYESHPELQDSIALSKEQVKQLVAVCKRNNIQLIPQVNLLGHQSWASVTGNLLKLYPQFDETPHVRMPVNYVWPNADSLYCKSYCPLHPEVHSIVFDIVDEICDVFEATAFHAGMDEVFYIGDSNCSRCAGKDKAALFAGEVNKIQQHLEKKKRTLWIWGDRLIDGQATGLGEWEGSLNNTHPAIDLVSKAVVICDWHYEKAAQTPLYFAGKGFKTITCSWRNPVVAAAQVQDMVKFKTQAKSKHKKHYQGIMQTVWTGTAAFLDEYYAAKALGFGVEKTQSNCFKAILDAIDNASKLASAQSL